MRPEQALNIEFDQIIISVLAIPHVKSIEQQLAKIGIPKFKIKVLNDDVKLMIQFLSLDEMKYSENIDPRVHWLKNAAYYMNMKKVPGSVAECGVFKGNFAHFINKYFPNRKFYLFDSFEGFRQSDVEANRIINDKEFEQSPLNKVGFFSQTSPELVMKGMLFPDQCEIHQGYIPESAKGLKDEFCFVNLDMDLYKPMFEGLKIFYPMMVKQGILLLHDYFSPEISKTVQKAVKDYENFIGYELYKMPIGDFYSIAIIKI